MTAEEWRPVDGFDGYMVSSLGRVISYRQTRSGHVMAQAIDNYGYPTVSLTRNGKYRPYRVHGLVARAFHGPRPDGKEARHLNGVKTDCRASNLQWGTHRQNMRDMLGHGTGWGSMNARKTHCPREHEYTPENTKVHRGRRFCRACARAANRAYYRRRTFAAAGIPA